MTPEAAVLRLPDPAEVRHVYKGSGRDRPRFYRHREGWEYPGVTTVLGAWDKSGLIDWSARIEREACLEAAAETWRQRVQGVWTHGHTTWTSERFVAEMEALLGEARQHVKVKEKAGDLGGSVHKTIDGTMRAMIAGTLEPPIFLDPDALMAYAAWRDHFSNANIVPLRMEQPVWSHAHRYAGTIDLLALRDGKLGVVDYKTSRWWSNSFHMQVEAYWRAADELLGAGAIEWAELWKLPKQVGQDFEVRTLGQCDEWVDGPNNQRICKPRPLTRDQLFRDFCGILVAWNDLIRPQEEE